MIAIAAPFVLVMPLLILGLVEYLQRKGHQ